MAHRRQEKNKDAYGYEGLQDEIRTLTLPELAVVRNIYADRDYWVDIETEEFTSICPKTGLPDYATIRIRYIPDQFLLELKSLKYYLVAYRNIGIFQENAVNRIADDLVQALQPRKLEVIGEYRARGGIRTTVRYLYPPD